MLESLCFEPTHQIKSKQKIQEPKQTWKKILKVKIRNSLTFSTSQTILIIRTRIFMNKSYIETKVNCSLDCRISLLPSWPQTDAASASREIFVFPKWKIMRLGVVKVNNSKISFRCLQIFQKTNEISGFLL